MDVFLIASTSLNQFGSKRRSKAKYWLKVW